MDFGRVRSGKDLFSQRKSSVFGLAQDAFDKLLPVVAEFIKPGSRQRRFQLHIFGPDQ